MSDDALANLLQEDRTFPPSPEFAAQANAQASMYDEAAADRLGFWAEQARRLDWAEPWTEVLDWSNAPFARWFVDGRINLCHNAVDRHLAERADQPALIYVSTETNTEVTYSFAQLSDEVQRMAAI